MSDQEHLMPAFYMLGRSEGTRSRLKTDGIMDRYTLSMLMTTGEKLAVPKRISASLSPLKCGIRRVTEAGLRKLMGLELTASFTTWREKSTISM